MPITAASQPSGLSLGPAGSRRRWWLLVAAAALTSVVGLTTSDLSTPGQGLLDLCAGLSFIAASAVVLAQADRPAAAVGPGLSWSGVR